MPQDMRRRRLPCRHDRARHRALRLPRRRVSSAVPTHRCSHEVSRARAARAGDRRRAGPRARRAAADGYVTQRRRHQVRPEQRPCPPLTHWGIAIVRASYQLPIAAKLVLELLRELDRGDGAFLAPAQAAAQLGMGQRYFEEVRAGLVRLGLVVQVPVEGSRLDFWFPRLPHGFESEPPAGATREIRMAWIRQWADALDLALERG